MGSGLAPLTAERGPPARPECFSPFARCPVRANDGRSRVEQCCDRFGSSIYRKRDRDAIECPADSECDFSRAPVGCIGTDGNSMRAGHCAPVSGFRWIVRKKDAGKVCAYIAACHRRRLRVDHRCMTSATWPLPISATSVGSPSRIID